MMKVELTEEEWSKLINCAVLAPYSQVAFLIQKIMPQLQKQQQQTESLPDKE